MIRRLAEESGSACGSWGLRLADLYGTGPIRRRPQLHQQAVARNPLCRGAVARHPARRTSETMTVALFFMCHRGRPTKPTESCVKPQHSKTSPPSRRDVGRSGPAAKPPWSVGGLTPLSAILPAFDGHGAWPWADMSPRFQRSGASGAETGTLAVVTGDDGLWSCGLRTPERPPACGGSRHRPQYPSFRRNSRLSRQTLATSRRGWSSSTAIQPS